MNAITVSKEPPAEAMVVVGDLLDGFAGGGCER